MEIPGSYRWLSKSPGDGGRHQPTRRVLLASAFAALLRAQKAEVSSFDFSLLDDGVVPADLFFVREHFPVPSVSLAGWRLSISGAVTAPFEISYDELTNLPRRVLPATLECAENAAGGGLVSHGEWTGHSLAALLEKSKPSPQARAVRLEGADGFSHTISLAKASHADTLIVTGLNGERLPLNHGFPLRAIVPGWYGMASIKWLRRIEVLDSVPSPGAYVRRVRSLLTGVRADGEVTAMNVNSAFSRPVDGATLFGRRFTLRGAAWAGENSVKLVEVSTDAGKSWTPAQLDSSPRPYAWVCWSKEWKISAAGSYELKVRATDDQGRVQPEQRISGRVDDFERNEWQTVQVTVA